jgi:hypothetical protein
MAHQAPSLVVLLVIEIGIDVSSIISILMKEGFILHPGVLKKLI